MGLSMNLSRINAVLCFRPLTGHDCLDAHLLRIGGRDSTSYSLSEWIEATGGDYLNGHVLQDRRQPESTSMYKWKGELYWAARRKMIEIH